MLIKKFFRAVVLVLPVLALVVSFMYAQEAENTEEPVLDSSVLEADENDAAFEPVADVPVEESEPSVQQAAVINEPQPEVQYAKDDYTIIRGDCLWDLSAKFYNTPWRWREIWNANAFIKNPNLIYPHDRLVIPGFTKAYGVIGKEEPAAGDSNVDSAQAVEEEITEEEFAEEYKEYIEEETPEDKFLPAELSGSKGYGKNSRYMEESFVVPEDWEYDGYVVGAGEKKLMVASGDIIFADAGSDSGIKPGSRCGIYRLGKTMRSKDRKVLGKVIRKIAIVEATQDIEPEVATLRVISCNDYIIKGDMVRVINR